MIISDARIIAYNLNRKKKAYKNAEFFAQLTIL